MFDFFEIDFLNVESKKSGDAIPMRYSTGDTIRIHVTDGGFQDTGDRVIEHINKYYDKPTVIDAVIVTHPDGDHAGGLRKLFDEYEVGALWMLRPWSYAEEIIDRFSRISSVGNLQRTLKEAYPAIAALEELAEERGVTIMEPFQGARIGHFQVLAPSKTRYLDLIVQSEKTPEAKDSTKDFISTAVDILMKTADLIRSSWGDEHFPESDTSAENNMSVIQYACLCDQKILLTGDAGRAALDEAADFAPYIGLQLPGIDRIQIPHHGSRHNVSTQILDRWLGPRLSGRPLSGNYAAIVSAAEDDDDHPKKSVIRAFMHRGANVISTERGGIQTTQNAPSRDGWGPIDPLPYPEEQEN